VASEEELKLRFEQLVTATLLLLRSTIAMRVAMTTLAKQPALILSPTDRKAIENDIQESSQLIDQALVEFDKVVSGDGGDSNG